MQVCFEHAEEEKEERSPRINSRLMEWGEGEEQRAPIMVPSLANVW